MNEEKLISLFGNILDKKLDELYSSIAKDLADGFEMTINAINQKFKAIEEKFEKQFDILEKAFYEQNITTSSIIKKSKMDK